MFPESINGSLKALQTIANSGEQYIDDRQNPSRVHRRYPSREPSDRAPGPMQPGEPLDAIPGNAASALRRAVARRHPGAAKGRRRTQRGSPWAPNARRPARGRFPLRALSAQQEKRPPRARRPALPQPCAAVLSAKAGLTAGFGMGPGDPRLCGRARGGRSPAALDVFEPARNPFTGATLAAAWRARKKMTHRARCFHRGCEELGLLVPLG